MRLAWIVALVAALPAVAGADGFSDANQQYVDGKFEAAVDQYEKLVADGIVHEDLYYNLGNAYFRAGKLGHAIYNYERALDLDPDMVDAAYNAEVARAAVGERIRDRLTGAESERWWVRATQVMTRSELTVALIACNVAFFGLLITLRFLVTGFRRTVVIVLACFFAVALLANAALFAGSVYLREALETGVVLPDQIAMREGIGSDTAERGLLHAGLRVRVLERRGEWVLVRLSNGVDGWVEARHVGLL